MKTIYLSEYGITPGTDFLPALTQLFQEYAENCEFVFSPGDYRLTGRQERPLSLSNTDVIPYRRLGIVLENMKNIRLTGSGARFLCEGRMQPLTLLGCENVTAADFVIDWEKPMVAEGIVTAFSDSSVDLFIDPAAFPHKFEDGRIFFDIGGEWSGICGVMQFDANTRTVRRTTGDRFGLGPIVGIPAITCTASGRIIPTPPSAISRSSATTRGNMPRSSPKNAETSPSSISTSTVPAGSAVSASSATP